MRHSDEREYCTYSILVTCRDEDHSPPLHVHNAAPFTVVTVEFPAKSLSDNALLRPKGRKGALSAQVSAASLRHYASSKWLTSAQFRKAECVQVNIR